MDSLNGFNRKNARKLVGKINQYLNGNEAPKFLETNCSQQENNFDCGAYAMIFTKIAARNATRGERLDNFSVEKNEVKKFRETINNIITTERCSKGKKDTRKGKIAKPNQEPGNDKPNENNNDLHHRASMVGCQI